MKTFVDLEVGQRLPPLQVPVTTEWIATDVALAQDPAAPEKNPDHFGGPIASPTLTNADFDRFLRANEYNMSGVIPTKTKQEYFGPLHLGQTIETTCEVIDKYERKGRTYITFEFVTSDLTGKVLMKKRDTFLQMPQEAS
ncbi:MAG: MaoC family dehydratase [Dehalococcoidia bacterium]